MAIAGLLSAFAGWVRGRTTGMRDGQKSIRPPAHEAHRRRRLAVAVRLGMIALLGGCGLWLVFELDKARRAQECLESGRRNCAIIQTR
jgi:hypothetical protein